MRLPPSLSNPPFTSASLTGYRRAIQHRSVGSMACCSHGAGMANRMFALACFLGCWANVRSSSIETISSPTSSARAVNSSIKPRATKHSEEQPSSMDVTVANTNSLFPERRFPDWALFVLAPLLCIGFYNFVSLCLYDPSSQPQTRTEVGLLSMFLQQAFDIFVVGLVSSVDSLISTVTFSLLPEVDDAHLVLPLYLVRPIIGASIVALLPLLHVEPCRGRRGVAVGLFMLASSCFIFARTRLFLASMVARALGAAASGIILVLLLQTAMMEAPASSSGWRLNAVMYGIVAGCACGPWTGLFLFEAVGLPGTMMILGATALTACCIHIMFSRWILESPCQQQAELSPSNNKLMFCAIADLLRDPRRCLLLFGVSTSAACLTLHCTLLPIYFDSGIEQTEHAQVFMWKRTASFMMGFAVIIVSALANRLNDHWSFRMGIVSLFINLVGLRAIVIGKTSNLFSVATAGLCASSVGVGGYIALLLPMLWRHSCEYGVFPNASVAAVISAAVGLACFSGNMAGVTLQMVFYRASGFELTIFVFEVVLLANIVAMAFPCPTGLYGWSTQFAAVFRNAIGLRPVKLFSSKNKRGLA